MLTIPCPQLNKHESSHFRFYENLSTVLVPSTVHPQLHDNQEPLQRYMLRDWGRGGGGGRLGYFRAAPCFVNQGNFPR